MADSPAPDRPHALEVLRGARAQVSGLLAKLSPEQMDRPRALGGGGWSVKDLVGHLASWEELALVWAEQKRPRDPSPLVTDDYNAREVARRRDWPLARVTEESAMTHARLIEAIERMDDDAWAVPVDVPGRGAAPLGLVIGRVLGGDAHGLFAHDLAHLDDLEAYARGLR